MSVCEVEELQWDALLICRAAERGKQHVNEPCISRTFIQACVLERGGWDAGESYGGCLRWLSDLGGL